MTSNTMQENLRMRVLSVAREVREWTEMQNNKREYHSEDLVGWCAIASAQLSRRFVVEEIPHRICMCEDDIGCHVFLIVDDHVVDVTATQFIAYEKEPVVIIHEREASACWYYQISREFQTPSELRRYQQKVGWPSDQTAYLR